MCYDHSPERLHPIKLAAQLLTTETDHSTQAAKVIRDLYDLAIAQEKLLACYRLNTRPSDKLLDQIGDLKGVTIHMPYPDIVKAAMADYLAGNSLTTQEWRDELKGEEKQ